MNAALQNTEKIKAVFLETQLFYAKHDNMPALIGYLVQIEKEFSSIAYESASMAIALKSFGANTFPDGWLLFANGAAAVHQAQVYVGLGWAIAKSGAPYSTTVKKLDSRFHFRIADGCGYYDGSFKRRHAVINKQVPVYLPAQALHMYYQGIGRSIWYTEKADINSIYRMIETFAPGWHADLWRGVGIAVAYVGGCDDADLEKLFQNAAPNSLQLACGAALAARSRMIADTMTADTDRCSRLWFKLNNEDANEEANLLTNGDRYEDWIYLVEDRLLNNIITIK